MQRRIRFITYGSSPLVGGFAPGQRACLQQTDAVHFVEQAKCAEYDDDAVGDQLRGAGTGDAKRLEGKKAPTRKAAKGESA